jgi:hypothetical protein
MYKKGFDFFSVSTNKNYEYMELQAYKQIVIGYFFIFFGTSLLIMSFFNLLKFFLIYLNFL